MRKFLTFALLFLALAGISVAQDTGIIHGIVPSNKSVRISLADLQTPAGQAWYDGVEDKTKDRDMIDYVCRENAPMGTVADPRGMFSFNQLPPGSYAVAACLQNYDNEWSEALSIVEVQPGQTVEIAFANTASHRLTLPIYSPDDIEIDFMPDAYLFDYCYGCFWPRYGFFWYYRPPYHRCAPFFGLGVGTVWGRPWRSIPRASHFREHPEFRNSGGHYAPSRTNGGRVSQPHYTQPHVESQHSAAPASHGNMGGGHHR